MVFLKEGLGKKSADDKKASKITQGTKWTHIKYKITTLVQFTFILIFSHKTIFFFQLLKIYDATRPDYMHGWSDKNLRTPD